VYSVQLGLRRFVLSHISVLREGVLVVVRHVCRVLPASVTVNAVPCQRMVEEMNDVDVQLDKDR
jgi:hypothetical protein